MDRPSRVRVRRVRVIRVRVRLPARARVRLLRLPGFLNSPRPYLRLRAFMNAADFPRFIRRRGVGR